MTLEGRTRKPKWVETTLGALARDGEGFQTGPFGSELKAAEYLPAEPPAAGRAPGVPVAMPRDLVAGRVETAAIARVAEERAEKLARYRVRPGDLLVARRGKLGRSALVTAAEDGWVCGTGCLVRLGPGAEPRYLIQYLAWPATVGWLAANAVGQTMPHLNTKILGRLPVRLPPPEVQRKIAEALESVDQAARSTRAVVDQLRRVRDGLLRDLLACGVRRAGGFQPTPSPVAEIPRGWRSESLGELATFINGYRFHAREWSEAGQPIVRIQNLNGSRDFKHFAGYPKPEWIVEPGDLLFAWAGRKGVSLGAPHLGRAERRLEPAHLPRPSQAGGGQGVALRDPAAGHPGDRGQGPRLHRHPGPRAAGRRPRPPGAGAAHRRAAGDRRAGVGARRRGGPRTRGPRALVADQARADAGSVQRRSPPSAQGW